MTENVPPLSKLTGYRPAVATAETPVPPSLLPASAPLVVSPWSPARLALFGLLWMVVGFLIGVFTVLLR